MQNFAACFATPKCKGGTRGHNGEERTSSYISGDGRTQLSGYFAKPDAPEPHPTVLILRGVAGPEDGYTEIADRIAGWGYFAFIHGWKVRGDDPPDAPVKADLTGVMAHLRGRSDVDFESNCSIRLLPWGRACANSCHGTP